MPVVNGVRFPEGTPESVIKIVADSRPELGFYPCWKKLATSKQLTWVWRMLDEAPWPERLTDYDREIRMTSFFLSTCLQSSIALSPDGMKGWVTSPQRMKKISDLANKLLDEIGCDVLTMCLLINGGLDDQDEQIRDAGEHMETLLEILARGAFIASRNGGDPGAMCSGQLKMRNLDQPNAPARFVAMSLKRALQFRWNIEDLDKPWAALEAVLTVLFEGAEVEELLDAEGIRKLPV